MNKTLQKITNTIIIAVYERKPAILMRNASPIFSPLLANIIP